MQQRHVVQLRARLRQVGLGDQAELHEHVGQAVAEPSRCRLRALEVARRELARADERVAECGVAGGRLIGTALLARRASGSSSCTVPTSSSALETWTGLGTGRLGRLMKGSSMKR
ncbi:hypothetical protein MASR1M6_26940 [Rubrivivax sp.]